MCNQILLEGALTSNQIQVVFKLPIVSLRHSMLRARVYKSTGSWYLVRSEDHRLWKCRIRGKLKIDKSITSTNPIAVGDWVHLEPESESASEAQAMITLVEDRQNYLVRQSPHGRHQKHIVASNLDQSVVIATLREPRTSTGFLDRFLVTCEAYHIPAILVFNKADILDEEDRHYFDFLRNLYADIGYPVLLISAETQQGLAEFRNLLQDKVTLLTGHSGVGKSTLINRLLPGQELATQEVSDWSGKGMHTTTFAEMYDLPEGGHLIDTPGIRELGVIDILHEELSGYFPEMKKFLTACKYNNCLHLNEPGCQVKLAVEEGLVSEMRYENYLRIMETIEERKY